MEVLVEFGESRKLLKPLSKDLLIKLLENEDPKGFVMFEGGEFEEPVIGSTAYLLQRWSTKWQTYVDVGTLKEVENEDRLRFVRKFPNDVKGSEDTKKAVNICNKVRQPSEDTKRALKSLFPSSSSSHKACKHSFDPCGLSVGEQGKAKKKAALPGLDKPRTLSFVLLDKELSTVPKGKARKKILESGRIKKIKIRRSMNSASIRQVVCDAFCKLPLAEKAKFMSCGRDNCLKVLPNQSLNGDEVIALAGSGNVYMCECIKVESDSVEGYSNLKSSVIDISSDSESADDVTVLKSPGTLHVPVQSTVKRIPSELTVPESAGMFDFPLLSAVEKHQPEPESRGISDFPLLPLSERSSPMETLSERRELILNQDLDYSISLEADQKKALESELDNELRMKIGNVKAYLRVKYPGDSEGIRIMFLSPTGERFPANFAVTDPVKALFGYAYAHADVTIPFGLSSTYPKKMIPVLNATLEDIGLTVNTSLRIEPSSEDFDPLVVFKEANESGTSKDVGNDFQAILENEKCCRDTLLKNMPTRIGKCHVLRRQNLYEDMLKVFSSEEVITENPFQVCFDKERGIDDGGLSREAFSTFWELAYQKHFDGGSVYTPIMSACADTGTLYVLGRILSVGYVVSGFIPVRIAFPTLAAILLHPLPDFPPDCLIEAFRESLTPVDANVLKEGFAFRGIVYPQQLLNRLISLFSGFDCLEVPQPHNLLLLCEKSARYMYFSKPFALICEMQKGVPSEHRQFWNSKGIPGLQHLIVALSVNPSKVLEWIEEPAVLSVGEQRVFGYLTQYIGRMKVEEVQKFLRFCTGSSVCIVQQISIVFNGTSGFARCPIAHTCSCTLELPRSYSNFMDFAGDFNCVLQAEDNGWCIDAI